MRYLLITYSCLTLLSCVVPLYQEPESLWVEMIDIGQGDAILLRHKDWNAMIDVGPPQAGIWDSLSARGIHQLDWVVISHQHLDHFGALLEVFPPADSLLIFANGDTLVPTQGPLIQRIYYPKDIQPTWEWRLFEGTFTAEDSHSLTQIGASSQVPTPDSIRIKILEPQLNHTFRGNAASIVLELSFKGQVLLFTGDLEEEGETLLLNKGKLRPVDFLKVGHHGSKTSSSLEFLGVIQPFHKGISYACDNQYGHPHASTMAHLELFSYYPDLEVHNTCDSGTLIYQVNEYGVFYTGN